jgi:hypothetical protein
MPPQVAAIREALAAAEAADIPVRAAYRELVAIIDMPDPEPRRVLTHKRSKEIARLKKLGMKRATICVRMGITERQYQRASEYSTSKG